MKKTDANVANEIIFELQDRIDKAIKYIENLKIDYENGISSGIFYELEKILRILKGE